VTKYLANYLDVGSPIDLSGCVTMAKCMSTDCFRIHTGQTSIVPNAVTNGRTRYRFMGHIFSQEDVLY